MDNKVRKYLDHYDAEVYTSYTDEDNCSFHIYREDTADGYEVFIAKYVSDKSINIMDDIHIYEHNLINVVMDKIHDGETIYVDNDIWNDNYMEDEIISNYEQESEEWEDEDE